MDQDKASEAFLKIYDQMADAIFRHCFYRVYNRETARDLTQEVFKKVWLYMSSGKEIKHYKSFVYQVANNVIIDYSRKKREDSLDQMHEQGFDASFDDSEKVSNSVDVRLLLQVIDRLEPMYKEALVMRYIDDLSPKEISQVTGLSVNVVSVRINRAVKQLQELLDEKHV